MYKHILVPVDGSEPSKGALRTAISLSKEMGARIRLLHVVDRAVYLAGYDPSGGVSADMFATLRTVGTGYSETQRQRRSRKGWRATTYCWTMPPVG